MKALTVEEAEALAGRVFDAIPERDGNPHWDRIYDADRERVASDAVGMREHATHHVSLNGLCHTCRRYTTGLLRTAALYGVTP